MKAITSYTKEETEKMREVASKTLGAIKGIRTEEYFEQFDKTPGWNHYTFDGKYTEKLVELLGHTPTEEEIIIIVDGGFYHFGASCRIEGNRFCGRVNVD